jgi:hypothetical protein
MLGVESSQAAQEHAAVVNHLMRQVGVDRKWAESYADVLAEFFRLRLTREGLGYEQVDQVGAAVGKSREFVIKAIAALVKAGLIS